MAAVRLPRAVDGRSALQVARQCVREGARIAMASFDQPGNDVSFKGRGNVVTAADYAVEARLQALLAAAYPAHALLSEETHADTGSDGWLWVLDPIDGTKNYAQAIPFFCINLALCYDGVPLLGLTYDPVRREEFLAVRGRGLRVNRRPAAVATTATVYDALLGYGVGYEEGRGGRSFAMLQGLWPGFQSSRDIGSAALSLAYVACGRYDLFVHPALSPWDVAAGIVLIEEAAGVVTDHDGKAATLLSSAIVAGTPGVHADFLARARGQAWWAP